VKEGNMKKLYIILPLALILCFMVGCQDKAAMAELDEFKAQAEVEEQNEALIRHHYEELNKGNVEIINESFAPEYGLYRPSNSLKPMSREEIIEALKSGLRASPDTNYSIEELYAVGDRVIVRLVITGTHEGDIGGIPATGNKIEYSAILISRIENGKIIEERGEADLLGLMMQLGMELKPKEGEK
jgi:steroid delta-isomerase-like uncharacterized protein